MDSKIALDGFPECSEVYQMLSCIDFEVFYI